MDCLEGMKLMDDECCHAIIADLPYQVTARNSWDSIIPFKDLWEAYTRLIKPNGAIVLTATQPFASQLVCSNLKLFKYEWIWHKSKTTGFLNAKRQPLRNHEQVLVFYKNQPTYNPQGIEICDIDCNRGSPEGVGTNYNLANPVYKQTQTNYPKSVQFFKSEGKTKHPTQKSLALMEFLIKTYTNEGDLVLDNTAGSGTTLLAARNTNRNYIGFENNEEYFKIAFERLNFLV